MAADSATTGPQARWPQQPSGVPLDTSADGWVIFTGMRFYSAERGCWGTVGKPAYRDPATCDPILLAARYWEIHLDDDRCLAVTGSHMLRHEPADIEQWWDRHLCPDAESIPEFHRTGVTGEDRMRVAYPRICDALAAYNRLLRNKLPKSARDYYRDQLASATGAAAWIERVFRVRALTLSARRQ